MISNFNKQSSIDPKKFYNDTMPTKLGGDYENARWHSSAFVEAQYAMMQDVLARHVLPRIQRVKRVFEVGPGAGTWSRVLIKGLPNAQFTLLDISSEMLARAQVALGKSDNLSYVEHDFVSYKSDEQFDVIFSSRAIEYMPDKVAVALATATLLRRDGLGIFITKMPKPLLDRIAGRHLGGFHKGQIAPSALARLFKDAGLKVVAIRMATASVPLFHSPRLNRLAYRLFRSIPLVFPLTWLAESYIIIVRKT